MLPSDARNSSQGFTLTEAVVIVVIIGILAAIALPNFLNWIRQRELDEALVELQGALQEAQNQAIRRSTTCAVLIPDGDGQTLRRSADSAPGCLLSDRRLRNTIRMTSNLQTDPRRIRFLFRGNTNDGGTVVLRRADNAIPDQRCLVIAPGIGIMRTGVFVGPPNTTAAANCRTR